jgi:hypothetical protein
MNEAEKENKLPAMNSFKKLNNIVLKEMKKSNEYNQDKERTGLMSLTEITSSLLSLFE